MGARHKKSDLVLAENLRQQALILDQIHDAVIATDLQGHITQWNKGAERLYGYTAEEVLGRHVSLLHPEDNPLAAANQVLATIAAKGQFEAELTKKTKSGETRVVHVSLSVRRNDQGRVAGFIGYSTDITARRAAEEERRLMERKLQEAQRLESLGVLAGGIAHDFNNLLTGILGNVNLAATCLPTASPARPYLERVEASALLAADLCKQMLAYAGKGQFLLKPCDLSRLVADTTALLEHSVGKNISITCDLADGLPAVLADPGQIRQIVMNLVTNAADAIGLGPGTIRISTVARELAEAELRGLQGGAALPPGRYVMLEVADDGCGMQADTCRRIFEPFFTTKFAGRGLGLAAVLGIVRGHGGALQVRSSPGAGSTFYLALPTTEAAMQEAAETRPEDDWRARGTALVVDDEETVRTVAAELLQLFGFQVVEARDGRDAVRRFRERDGRFEVVLLDLTMPLLDGHGVFRELVRIRPDVRVVLMSGFSQQQAIARFKEVRPSGFLQKPFGRETLRRVLAEVRGLPTTSLG